MFCPKCGNEIAEGTMFCKQCGYMVSGEKPQKTVISPESLKKVSRDYKKIIIGVVAVIAVVVIAKMLMGGSGGFSSYESVVRAYISAMENKNESEYLKCFSKNMQQDIKEGIEYQMSLEEEGGVITKGELPEGWYAHHSPYRFLYPGNNYDMEYAIEDIEEIPSKDIEGYNEKHGYKAKNGYYVSIKLWENVSGPLTRPSHIKLPVGKIGSKWYVLEPQEIHWPSDF